jgi:hypothetical protein
MNNEYENGNGNGHESGFGNSLHEIKSVLGSLGVSPFRMERFFSRHGKNVFEYDLNGNPLRWVAEDVSVTDDKGKIIYTQPAVRRPDFWSPLAIKVVASKDFSEDKQSDKDISILLERKF